MSELDLVFTYVPSSPVGPAFAEWYFPTGRAALSRISGANDISAFHTIKGPEGFNVLLRMKIDPLDDGLTETIRDAFHPCCGDSAGERPRTGLFRFASSFVGASAGEPVKTVFVVGRAAGGIPLEEFRAWYDEDHMGGLATVPGIVSATRYEALNDSTHSLAIYEVSKPDVMSTTAWKEVSKTAWTRRVRSRYDRWLDFRSVPLERSPAKQA